MTVKNTLISPYNFPKSITEIPAHSIYDVMDDKRRFVPSASGEMYKYRQRLIELGNWANVVVDLWPRYERFFISFGKAIV